MTERDARPNEIDPATSESVAPDHVQDDISAMLRDAARLDDGSTRMPPAVAVDVLAALRSEGWSGSTDSTTSEPPSSAEPQAPRTVVPLPGTRRTTSTQATDSTPVSQQADEPSPIVAQAPAAPMTTDDAAGASVVSLADHRARKRPKGRMLLGLGVAAAVVVGAAGVWSQSDSGNSSHVASAAPQTRLTGSGKHYTKSGFATETASMVKATNAPRITTQEDAQKAGLPTVPTTQQVSACAKSLATFLDARTGKVYVDVGMYEHKKSLIVVVVQGATKQAWALNPEALENSCTDKSDVLYRSPPLQA